MCNAVPPTVLTEKSLFSYHTLLKKKKVTALFFGIKLDYFFPSVFQALEQHSVMH